MKDEFAAEAARMGDDQVIVQILKDVCQATGMGFAAVARVTEQRWICCQVEDRIEFGLKPGDELEIKKTICDDIRKCGCAIIIDDVPMDEDWRSHPVPTLYGFRSYASLPLVLDDGSFFGTMCTLDPEPRRLSAAATVAALEDCAQRVMTILSERRNALAPQPTPD
jgi:GAF domain-containing protein